jgi:hypothetical protein
MTKNSGGNRTSRRPRNQVMREKLLKKLPAMLDAAIAAYQRIALSDPNDDPKSAAVNHAGAKAILVHIDQILKLAEATLDVVETPERVSSDLEVIIDASRRALSGDRGLPADETSADDTRERSP